MVFIFRAYHATHRSTLEPLRLSGWGGQGSATRSYGEALREHEVRLAYRRSWGGAASGDLRRRDLTDSLPAVPYRASGTWWS